MSCCDAVFFCGFSLPQLSGGVVVSVLRIVEALTGCSNISLCCFF